MKKGSKGGKKTISTTKCVKCVTELVTTSWWVEWLVLSALKVEGIRVILDHWISSTTWGLIPYTFWLHICRYQIDPIVSHISETTGKLWDEGKSHMVQEWNLYQLVL